MANEIYHSTYDADQIQAQIENGVPRINSTNKHWEVWDIETSAWVDTGVVAQGQDGQGDMNKSVYDSDHSVENAGGIKDYVEEHSMPKPILATTDPTTSTVGVLGQLYTNKSTSKLFQCVDISGGTYTWIGVGSSLEKKKFELTLPTTGWVKDDELNYYTQQFNVQGMLEEYDDWLDWEVRLTLQMTSEQQDKAFALWANNPVFECHDGYVIVEASIVPTEAIDVYARGLL